MITINALLKNMDTDIPLEQRTLADLMRSMGIRRIGIKYAGAGDSGGLEKMRAYSAQGDVIESPDIDDFLNALDKDIIESYVSSLHFDYYNGDGGNVLIDLSIEDSELAVFTECVELRYEEDETPGTAYSSMKSLQEDSKNIEYLNKVDALVKGMLAQGGELCIDISGEGDSGDIEAMYIKCGTIDEYIAEQDFDALNDLAFIALSRLGFRGFEIDSGGRVEIALTVNEDGQVMIGGKLYEKSLSEETVASDETIFDIKYRPEVSSRPGL